MTADTARVDELAAEYLAAAERGQAPDPADFLARHPEHAAELAAFLADLGRFGSFLGLSAGPSHDLTTDLGRGDDPPRERFGGYDLLGELGRGGMGAVYRARVAGTSLVVALKQLRAGGVRRFRDEIEAVAGLRHPNIVPVYHVGEHDGRPFYTMALVEGGSLDRHVARFRDDPRATAALVAKVARAIHFAHQRRVLHRDLKPANILLDEAGEPHVADFGLAARTDESGTATDAGPAAGSLPWMAPEAVRGDTPTTGVDVWALGVVLYELLTGERPFRGATWAELRTAVLAASPVAPREVNPRVPRDLEAICLRCLARETDRRYESASAVALELERWLRDEPVRARPAGRGERVARWCRRNPGIASGLAFVVALAAAVTAGAVGVADELEAEVVSAVCQNSEYDATLVAGNVQQRFDQLGGAVERAAAKLANGPPPPADPERAAAALRGLAETPVGGSDARPFVNAFVLDPVGRIVAIWPPDPNAQAPEVREQRFLDRDYFRRARADRVHVSRVFESRRDGLDKLALSLKFQPRGAADEWVLAATVTTDRKLDLGVVSMSDSRHEAILVAPRDAPGGAGGEYVILVHQALAPRSPTRRFGTAAPGPPRDSDRPELGPPPPNEPRPFPPDRDYRDPFAATNPDYAGRWLTGSARVGNSELVVVVQQRYSDSITPHRSLLRRSLSWLAAAGGVGLLTFAGLRAVRRVTA
jgi:serine/threonine-protein kinase